MCKLLPAISFVIFLSITSLSAFSEEIGSVDTKFNLLSPDDSIKIEVFKDPKIEGIACYLSRAQKGGYKGVIGLAEDTSDASLDCRQTGPIKMLKPFKKGESVFKERRSFIFKRLKVIRYCDSENNTVVYLVYSEKIIEGSPKNSISAVPISKWHTQGDEPLDSCNYK